MRYSCAIHALLMRHKVMQCSQVCNIIILLERKWKVSNDFTKVFVDLKVVGCWLPFQFPHEIIEHLSKLNFIRMLSSTMFRVCSSRFCMGFLHMMNRNYVRCIQFRAS